MGVNCLHGLHQVAQKSTITNLEKFSQKAKKMLIDKVFVLDISTFSITTSAVCSDIELLGGPAIHDVVENPNDIYHFAHQNLFAKMLEEK